MSQILEKLHKVDPNDNDAVKESVNGFFQNVVKHTEAGCKVWLRELEYVITRFPRQCAPHRAVSSRVVAQLLRAECPRRALLAARAAHALLQVRPSSDKSWSARAAWRDQLDVLLSAAHTLVERTHTGAPTSPRPPARPRPLWADECALWAALRDLGSHDDVTGSTHHLRNVLLFIQAMLVEVYPVSKPVCVGAVLDVVVRVLSAPSAGHGEVSRAALLHTHALNTLDALVAGVGVNLVPWSAVVVRCVMQALHWSATHAGEHVTEVRCAAYTSLCAWVSVAGAGATRAFMHQLCAHLTADITRNTTAHTHTNEQKQQHTHNNKKLSKKCRRRVSAALHQHARRGVEQEGDAVHSERVLLCALRCVEAVCSGVSEAHTRAVLSRVLLCARSLDALGAECALAALRALHHTRHLAAHTHLLLHVYHQHQHHAHAQVRTFCSQGLLELKLQLHGAPASLNFDVEPTSPALSSAMKPHSLSRNNRAALNSLLGKHTWGSSLDAPSSDDVITIGAPPSSKKPRLDSQVITDNISVSSDSVESLDSTDDDDVIVDEDGALLSNVVTNNVEGADSRGEQAEKREDAGSLSKVSTECEQSPAARVSLSNIYEANTQIPLNTSTDQDTIEDDESPISMEIVYDPNIVNKVTILERTEDDTLPSTNDTDDIHITCGQLVRNSQELNLDINKPSEQIIKVNGVGDRGVVGDEDSSKVDDNVEVHSDSKEITVDDMLADFVDEPNQLGQVEA